MKVRCPVCLEMVTRKRLVIVPGLRFGREHRPARCCEDCFNKPDEEHRKEYERECEGRPARLREL